MPQNLWVQVQKDFIFEYDFPDLEPSGCIEPHGPAFLFKDMLDDDGKVITFSENDVALGPIDERFCFIAALFDTGFTLL